VCELSASRVRRACEEIGDFRFVFNVGEKLNSVGSSIGVSRTAADNGSQRQGR
jgi:hypothetical protein